jgi:hypothetical protein
MRPLQQIRPVSLLVGVAGAITLQTAALALDLSRPGVVCDNSQRICYDSQGPSVNQTRRSYGQKAERDLLRQISGRPPAQDFQLSGGEVCSINRRTCWDDGWQRRNVSHRLTKQLFGTSGGGGNISGESTCQLQQRGRNLFSGGCRLSRRQDFAGSAYVVETRDGRRYSFYNQGNGRLVLRDATGTWPVAYSNRGNAMVFRWSDLQLDASRGYGSGFPGGPGFSSGTGSSGGWGNSGWGNPNGANPGYGRSGSEAVPAVNTLEGLLNSLFN